MAKVRPGKAYEMFLAERAKLEKAAESAKEARCEAERVEQHAVAALEKLVKFEADPVSWANGDTGERDTGLLHGFKKFSCLRCGSTGVSPDGSCTKCADEAGGSGAKNLVNIYQTV